MAEVDCFYFLRFGIVFTLYNMYAWPFGVNISEEALHLCILYIGNRIREDDALFGGIRRDRSASCKLHFNLLNTFSFFIEFSFVAWAVLTKARQ